MLPYGCKKRTIEQLLPNQNIISDLNYGQLHITGLFSLTSISGDCTACVISMENISLTNINANFKIATDIMSLSGRINAFFSKTIYGKDTVDPWIKKFKQFNVVGLNVQKSNRDPYRDWWQISGILKCPNPIINDYTSLESLPEKWSEHKSNDVTKFNVQATLYKLPKLKEIDYAKV